MSSMKPEIQTDCSVRGAMQEEQVLICTDTSSSIQALSVADSILQGAERENLRRKNQELRAEIQTLKDNPLSHRIDKLERALMKVIAEDAEEVLELRDIPDELAIAEIRELFETSGSCLVYTDIMRELRLDLGQVVRVCNDLIKSGEITFDEGD